MLGAMNLKASTKSMPCVKEMIWRFLTIMCFSFECQSHGCSSQRLKICCHISDSDYTTNSFFVMMPCCPRENKRTDGINKSAIPLCSPTSLVGVKTEQSLWKWNLLNYLVNREMILVSLKV